MENSFLARHEDVFGTRKIFGIRLSEARSRGSCQSTSGFWLVGRTDRRTGGRSGGVSVGASSQEDWRTQETTTKTAATLPSSSATPFSRSKERRASENKRSISRRSLGDQPFFCTLTNDSLTILNLSTNRNVWTWNE